MSLPGRAVIVKELPIKCNPGTSRQFLDELVSDLTQVVRPAVVLDCASASIVDRRMLRLILCALEEAMKRNGDVRLAGLHKDAWAVLEAAGSADLFKHFENVAEARNSYTPQIRDEFRFDLELPDDETAANAA